MTPHARRPSIERPYGEEVAAQRDARESAGRSRMDALLAETPQNRVDRWMGTEDASNGPVSLPGSVRRPRGCEGCLTTEGEPWPRPVTTSAGASRRQPRIPPEAARWAIIGGAEGYHQRRLSVVADRQLRRGGGEVGLRAGRATGAVSAPPRRTLAGDTPRIAVDVHSG